MNRAGPTSVTAGVLSAMSRTLPLASNFKYKQNHINNNNNNNNTGELGYDRLNGTRKIGPSYAKSVIYI